MESGGYAAKLGDRYERRWVVRQLLLLLQERNRSVTIERVGDDEAGVDLWVEGLDGGRDAHQCKAENGTSREWTIGDLDRRGVLGYAAQQLRRDPAFTLTSISSVPAVDLRDLSRSARDSAGDSEDYYRDQITQRSSNSRSAFRAICAAWALDSENAKERQIAFSFLRQLHCHLFSDDRESREELRMIAQLSVEGDPDHVIFSTD